MEAPHAQGPPGPSAAQHDERSFWWRRFSPPNPFYLLSAACVVHGTGLSIVNGGDGLAAEVLLALVGGYVLLMAVVAFVIVRLWRVWDDARSILLIVLLLLVELALIADGMLLTETARGARLLLIGLGVAVLASECVLRGLRLSLPVWYRGPFYIQVALLFLYPLVLLGPIRNGSSEPIQWALFGFPVVVALSILMLIPAMRRGPDGVRSGAGWNWPWYPWTLFAFFGFCLCLRSYTLCLSFDPVAVLNREAAVEKLASVFAPYSLIPPVYAACWLVLEAAARRGHAKARLAALLLPFVCLLLAFPGAGSNAAAAQFIERFTGTLGSPAWLTLIGLAIYFSSGYLRGVAGTERALLLTLLALSVVPVNAVELSAVNMDAVQNPNPVVLLLAAAIAVARGHRRVFSRDYLEGAMYGIAALASAGVLSGWSAGRGEAAGHLVLLAVILIGAVMEDDFADALREIGAVLLIAAGLRKCGQTFLHPDWTWQPLAYLVIAAALSIIVGRRLRHIRYWYAGATNLLLAYAMSLNEGCQFLSDKVEWEGLTSFAIGMALLHVGLLFSAAKGGGLRVVHERMIQICARE